MYTSQSRDSVITNRGSVRLTVLYEVISSLVVICMEEINATRITTLPVVLVNVFETTRSSLLIVPWTILNKPSWGLSSHITRISNNSKRQLVVVMSLTETSSKFSNNYLGLNSPMRQKHFENFLFTDHSVLDNAGCKDKKLLDLWSNFAENPPPNLLVFARKSFSTCGVSSRELTSLLANTLQNRYAIWVLAHYIKLH